MIAIVTNIDNDHLATHDGDFARLKQSFVDFLHNLPFYGLAVLCADDEQVRSILEAVGAAVRHLRLRRGRGRARGRRASASGCNRTTRRCARAARRSRHHQSAGPAQRAEFAGGGRGRHRTRRRRCGDSARARAISRASTGACSSSARSTGRAARRCSSTTTAIIRPKWPRRSMRCARAGPTRRLVLAFQPHRYTRTRDLLDDFGRVLERVRRAAGHRGVRGRRSADRRRRRPRHLPRGAQPRTGRAGIRRARRRSGRVAARRAARRRRGADHGRRQHRRRRAGSRRAASRRERAA